MYLQKSFLCMSCFKELEDMYSDASFCSNGQESGRKKETSKALGGKLVGMKSWLLDALPNHGRYYPLLMPQGRGCR